MRKKYLKVEIIRNSKVNSIACYLLTDNITATLWDAPTNELRLYFKDANPFAYLRVFLTDADFCALDKNAQAKVTREGSIFIYQLVER